MVTVSLCMIVKNEEDVLAHCLDSVKGIADEIIIADMGSNDRTKEIAGQYTDQIFDFQWTGDFSLARNASFSKAKMDYIMWLNADDFILEEDRKKWIALKKNIEPYIHTVMMKYNAVLDKEDLIFSYYRERMIKREAGMYWKGALYETIIPTEPILYTEIAVTRNKLSNKNSDRNLWIFEYFLAQGRKMEPQFLFYYGKELYEQGNYEKAVAVLEWFLKEKEKQIEKRMEACQILLCCYDKLKKEKKESS